jgi:PAS domain S-box-containing protein
MKTRRPSRKRVPPEYRDIFDYASIGIYRSTPDGRFLIANPALARMLGYASVAEVLALNLARDVYVRAADRAPVMRKYARLRVSWTTEIEWKKKDGASIWVLVNGRAVRDAAGRVRYCEAFVQDITEPKHAAEEIADSRRRLRNLSRRLHEVAEQERKRIAREIHDDLGQPLTALRMDLAWLSARLAPDAAPLLAKARAMEQVVDDTIDRVRDIATQLRPAVLDDLGLVPAIEGEAEALERRSGLRCELDLPHDTTRLDEQRATTLFRVLQEVLTNVARHAGAKLVRIHLRVTPGEIALEVSDDGRGITESEAANRRSIGLLGMRERVAAWGGEFGILGCPGGGTRVTVCLPLEGRAPLPDTL